MRRRSAVLVLVVVGVVAAACGGGSGNGVASKPPNQILQAALSALRSASSVRIVGTIPQNGSQFSFDGSFFNNNDFQGTLTGLKGGGTVKVIRLGGTDYIYASPSYWESQGLSASQTATIGGKWVSLPDSQAGLGDLSIKALANNINTSPGSAKAGTTGTIDGQPAVSVITSNGTVWVATTGTPYPIEVNSTQAGNQGNATFSDWNSAQVPTAPTNVISASSIGGASGTTGTGTTGTGTTGTGATGTGTTGTGTTGTGATGTGATGTGATGSGTGTTGTG